MHIAEGSVSPEIIAAGWGLTALGVTLGLRRTHADDIPRAAILSAAFFVASLVRVNFGGTSVHLVMNGQLWSMHFFLIAGICQELVVYYDLELFIDWIKKLLELCLLQKQMQLIRICRDN